MKTKKATEDLLALNLSPVEIANLLKVSHTTIYTLKANPTKNFKIKYDKKDFALLVDALVELFFKEYLGRLFHSFSFSIFSFLQHFASSDTNESGTCNWCKIESKKYLCENCQKTMNKALFLSYIKETRLSDLTFKEPRKTKKKAIKKGFFTL